MAAFTPPAIVSCDTWGAKVRPPNRIVTTKAIGIVIHHTATENVDVSRLSDAASQQRAFAFARSIQLDHIHRGYGDSGQHFTVTRDGMILEGRRGSLATLNSGMSMVSGAHTTGATGVNEPHHIHYWNDGYIGIENEGTYSFELPPDALWDSLILLCAFIVSQYGFWPLRILGHRDFNKTACPGETLYGQIGSLRRNVSTLVRGRVDW
jgi:N-acetylmuramoyl-L-alanine amidase-like protein